MTRGAMCPEGDNMSGVREPPWRYDKIKGAMKAPRTASAVTSAGYNMGFNSARCLALARCDSGRRDPDQWNSGRGNLGHENLGAL